MKEKVKVAIIGPGNIGIDLMYKIMESKNLKLDIMVGIDPESEGLRLARDNGFRTSSEGISSIIGNDHIKIVFDSSGAKPHLKHAPLLEKDGKVAIDLTPAAVGPYVVPTVNLNKYIDSPNINLVTCGGQATIPMVKAVSQVSEVKYAEIVATLSSISAGPGTRQNIDEFTQTTARGIEIVGKVKKGKAIIILNPAEPPIMMRCTIYLKVKNSDAKAIQNSVESMVAKVKEYVPGYKLIVPPIIDGDKVTIMVEVEGAGHYLPKYSGNLDIITSAARAVGEIIAQRITNRGR